MPLYDTEHSYMIQNICIQSQDKQKLHSHNTHFKPSFSVKNEYYGDEVFGLSKCAHSYTILNTLIQS